MRSYFELALDSDPVKNVLGQLFHAAEDFETGLSGPSRSYLQDRKAMASTAVDIKEGSNSYTFYADLPGLARSDIQVRVEDENVLSIRGKRKRDDGTDDGEKFIRMESRPAKFFRKFTLPSDANVEAITATCADGVLTVKVPKLPPPESEKPKTIEVKVS